ncbi:MAG: sugar transferase, partial [Actinobacteria bacterium]|nr:sugar transferase [Actinomycetota bacterium]
MQSGGRQAASGSTRAPDVSVRTRFESRAVANLLRGDVRHAALVPVRAPHQSELEAFPAGVATVQPGRRREPWLRRYQAALVAIDLVGAGLAVVVALLVRFLPEDNPSFANLLLAALFPLAWIAVVALNRAYEGRFVGVGAAEFERIFRSFLYLTALVSLAAFATKLEVARGFVLISLSASLVLGLVGRYAARRWLHRQRARGFAMKSVVAVGDAASILEFVAMIERDRFAGMRVVAACIPADADMLDAQDVLNEKDIPVLGTVDSVVEAVSLADARTVAVVSSTGITPERLRWISWQLEGTETDLVLAPALTQFAGTRLHIQPVAGLPLLHVDEPEFSGFRRFLKASFDRSMALFAIVLLTPVLLGIAVIVRATTKGPAFFKQIRIGRDGRPFTIYKFRSMYVDAEQRTTELASENVNADGLLFKVRDDPRVTRVGRVLRKFSLDELPQFLNVLNGSMSLVGPRPPLASEVERYGDDVRRRLLVKPGLTGLWQISGRSDLPWKEAVSLDLHYVENWSFALDVMILWKTAFAVVR